MSTDTTALRHTTLHALHLSLGARMVPFAGYSMPVQYPLGLMAEHKHTRSAAGLFDVSHMGQLSIRGDQAGAALESVLPIDVLGLGLHKQRYGLLLHAQGGILDDLMVVNRGRDFLLVVNGACKHSDTAYLRAQIGTQCDIQELSEQALLALQGPLAAQVLGRWMPGIHQLVFMTGGDFKLPHPEGDIPIYISRSGYTGEDGFELSVHQDQVRAVAELLLAQAEVQAIGLGARNSLRLEAGLPLYGSDMNDSTTPVEAALAWAIPKVRRSGGARAGGFPGAQQVLAQLDKPEMLSRKRVGLVALERVPVREPSTLQDAQGHNIGQVTSGLLVPTVDRPIAMGYVIPAMATVGSRLSAMVRGKPVPMEVVAMPFIPPRYHRG
jgi:aminomethyltransferase